MPNRFTSGAILCCLLLYAAPAKTLERPRMPSPRRNLWDFALEKINPKKRDYGAQLERERQIFIRQLADPRLWGKAAALALMLSGGTVIVRQRAEKRRREIITAELLAHYHNALAETRIRLEQAISDNGALREAAHKTADAAAADLSSMAAPATPADIYLENNFPARTRSRRTAATTESPPMTTRIAELERQLRESREREKLLERELERVPSQPRPNLPHQLTRTSPRGKAPV